MMMPLVVVMVGKTRAAFIQEGMAFYAKRLRLYHPLDLITVREEKPGGGMTPAQILAREGGRILTHLPKTGRIITLEPTGREVTSEGLAQWLEHLSQNAASPLVFIIGGHLGLAPAVRQAAHDCLTFTHEMTRLILLEQLYRAATIRAGHPYHI